ncbi:MULTISPECIES: tyrosinase family oxidase copper chaperone [Streptomyces]|uniref:tyrosinase family oxidase copper chaperone n=1 Tax=Streptomyces TaxID=1883 RepID=UPI0006AD12F7|nr:MULTISPECIES: tyrosinase family oxidase copper chaperone [Streptomyces]ALC25933.1 tyrosinase [Streptomyces sp. CFMR 7]MBT3074891.1 tyrosinase cofactor [Streptomyces sp. COG21]MBT3081943.1 tyrosinase cofactor [Streptomyces sp. COG20]MBT3096971.1 tyrosinase cofactor [Streptomyces sp. CBG30]MBT3103713.1 tyrosinase cofactor [Streptomyces sp. COG19]
MSRTTDAGDAPRGPSRRILLRTGFTAVVAAGTAAVLIPLHDHPQDTAPAPAQGPGHAAAGAAGAEEFAEMYRGREIRGGVSVLVPAAGPGGGAHHAEPVAEIRIDGRPLHVMRRADGTYLSDVTHYESFPTLRETARAAVDELGTARLALPASHHR